jgi:hypothetical protein
MGVVGLGMGRKMLYINRESGFRTEVRALCDVDEAPAVRQGIRVKREEMAEEFDVPSPLKTTRIC